jgi:ribosomal protein S21
LVNVIAHDDENFDEMLGRFHDLVHKTYSRPWHKRRYGYYEKPSVLRRKQNRTKAHNRRSYAHGGKGVRLPISLDSQFRRNGPSNAMGQ